MYLPTMALLMFAASTGATASLPNTSNTHLQINNAPTLVMKSRTTVHLRSAKALARGKLAAANDRETHDALRSLPNAIRDASAEAVGTKGDADEMMKHGLAANRAPERPRRAQMKVRGADSEQHAQRRGMTKRRQRRRTAQAQRRRMPKILPKLA